MRPYAIARRTLLPDSPLVESQFLALQHVPIAPPTLPRPRGHDGVQPAGLELPLQRRLDLALGLDALGLLLLDALAPLLVLDRLGLLALGLAPAAQARAVVRLVPLAEGRGVDLHHGGLGEGVGAHQLVVRRVEGDHDDARLARHPLAAPAEVARVEAQRAELAVAATGAD